MSTKKDDHKKLYRAAILKINDYAGDRLKEFVEIGSHPPRRVSKSMQLDHAVFAISNHLKNELDYPSVQHIDKTRYLIADGKNRNVIFCVIFGDKKADKATIEDLRLMAKRVYREPWLARELKNGKLIYSKINE